VLLRLGLTTSIRPTNRNLPRGPLPQPARADWWGLHVGLMTPCPSARDLLCPYRMGPTRSSPSSARTTDDSTTSAEFGATPPRPRPPQSRDPTTSPRFARRNPTVLHLYPSFLPLLLIHAVRVATIAANPASRRYLATATIEPSIRSGALRANSLLVYPGSSGGIDTREPTNSSLWRQIHRSPWPSLSASYHGVSSRSSYSARLGHRLGHL
jgi:hypothetical protein